MTGRCRGSGCTILGYVHPVSWIRVHYPGVCTPGVVDPDALPWGTYTRCRGPGCTTLGYVQPVSWIRMRNPWGAYTRCRGSGCTILGCVHPVSWIRMYYPGVRTPATVKILTVGRSPDRRSSPGFRANRSESQLAAIEHQGQISEIRARARASVVRRAPQLSKF